MAQHVRRQVNVVLLEASCRRREGSSVVVLAPGTMTVVNSPQSPPAVGYLVEEDEVRVLLRLRARLSSSRTPAPLISLAHRVSVTLRRSTVAVVPFPSAITASARCSGPCSRQRLQTADARRSALDAHPLQKPGARLAWCMEVVPKKRVGPTTLTVQVSLRYGCRSPAVRQSHFL